jgi:DNA-binding transcriptional regulator YiaG
MREHMKPEEYKLILKSLDLTQAAGGHLLNVTARMSRHYANGTRRIPYLAAALLRLMIRKNVTPEVVAQLMAGPSQSNKHNQLVDTI